MAWKTKDLLSIQELSADEINLVLDTAVSFKEVSTRSVKKVPALKGRTVVLFFHEPSTRTRTSFELAAKRLSADLLTIQSSSSSLIKGETLIDTVKTLESMTIDAMVIRHGSSGVPQMLAGVMKASVINAGDGSHEHPTQALLDLYTIREHKGKIAGLTVTIVGDITHSRVARSNIYGLLKLGAKVRLCAPPTLLPTGVEKWGVQVFHDLDKALEGTDVVYVLRLQMERQKNNLFPTVREYSMMYGVTTDRLKKAKKDAIVMHPGPMNRGIEISSGVADGAQSVIDDQVTNGVAVRMAVLYLLMGEKEKE
ncbi:MAG TPA: aspartate carbamoyltransferase catalytic subunit [bacterium]